MRCDGMCKGQLDSGSIRRPVVSPWCHSPWKRAFDLTGSLLLLIVLSPLMVLLALAVKLTSPGPVFFRQRRPGKDGREFAILKFRTMLNSRERAGPLLTRAADPRVTSFGRFMRKWKLDELPQLLNVLRGEMSFVGPRPQPTSLWSRPSIAGDAAHVLSVCPGITSQATLNFRNEEELLAPLSFEEVEDVYMQTLMPIKLRMELEYLERATFESDLRIILQTAVRVFKREEQKNDALIKRLLPAINGRDGTHPQKAQTFLQPRGQEQYAPVVEESD